MRTLVAVVLVAMGMGTQARADDLKPIFDCLDAFCGKPMVPGSRESKLGTCYLDRKNQILVSNSGRQGEEFYASNSEGTYFFRAPFDSGGNPSIARAFSTMVIRFPNKQSVMVGRSGISSHQFSEYFLGDPSVQDTAPKAPFTLTSRDLVSERKALRDEAYLVASGQIREQFRDFMSAFDFNMGGAQPLTVAEYNKLKNDFLAPADACQPAARANPRLKAQLDAFYVKMRSFTYLPSPGATSGGDSADTAADPAAAKPR